MITRGISIVLALVAISVWELGLPDLFSFWGFWLAFAIYALVGLSFWTTQSANRPKTASWTTSQATETAQVVIDTEVLTVTGEFDDESIDPRRRKPRLNMSSSE